MSPKSHVGSSFIDSLKLHTNACLHIITPMNVNPIVLFRFGVLRGFGWSNDSGQYT